MSNPEFWALFLGSTAFLAGVYGAWQRFLQIAHTEDESAPNQSSGHAEAPPPKLKVS
jgi:hypothetical protein